MKFKTKLQNKILEGQTAVQFAAPLAMAACALTGDQRQKRFTRPVI